MEKRLLGRQEGRTDDNIESIKKRFRVTSLDSAMVVSSYLCCCFHQCNLFLHLLASATGHCLLLVELPILLTHVKHKR